jgi:hypothetical protein
MRLETLAKLSSPKKDRLHPENQLCQSSHDIISYARCKTANLHEQRSHNDSKQRSYKQDHQIKAQVVSQYKALKQTVRTHMLNECSRSMLHFE